MSREAEILKRAREALEQLRSLPESDRAKLAADGTEQALLDVIERLTPFAMDADANRPMPPLRRPGRS
jgi:hypothetical protein